MGYVCRQAGYLDVCVRSVALCGGVQQSGERIRRVDARSLAQMGAQFQLMYGEESDAGVRVWVCFKFKLEFTTR